MSFSISHQQTPANSNFTCNTCGIKFVTADLQRRHMKTDWHRYNLKRRVAQLPSISSEVFAEKVVNMTREESHEDEYGFYVPTRRIKHNTNRSIVEERGREVDSDTSREPSPARSVASEFSTFSLGDHTYESAAETGSEGRLSDFSEVDITSDSVVSEQTDEDDDDSSDAESFVGVALPITSCFFCGQSNKEIEANIRHMSKHHGLYIPERSFLMDLEGLLLYMSEVISLDYECLVCGFQGRNLESVRQHMSSKGHCTIPYETDDEKQAIAEFYQFDTGTDAKKTSTKTISFGTELVLPTGPRAAHRTQRRTTALVARPKESETTVAVVDRRFAPGITAHQLSKQEKEAFRVEQRQKEVDVKRGVRGAGANFQKHYRDTILGT